MVVRPNIWGKDSFGGFLENKESENRRGLITGSEQHNHKICLNDKAYNIINYLNSLEFSVVKEQKLLLWRSRKDYYQISKDFQ
jgi:hypothetical protein